MEAVGFEGADIGGVGVGAKFWVVKIWAKN